MTACPDRHMLLHALLDDELDAANAAACEAHLKNCVGCTAAYEQLRLLRSTVQDSALRYAAPAGLRDRIEAALPAPAPRPSHFAWAALGSGLGAGLAAAASLVLAVSAPQLADDTLSRQLVDSHVRSLLATHLVDVATSDRHVVKPWFNGRIDFSPPTPDLKDQGFPLAGGRLDYIGGRVVPAIVYRRRLHTINLFVWPRRPDHAAGSVHFDGYNLVHWEKDGLEYYAVSDIGTADLVQFRQAFLAAR
ncbi:MAG: zf-HC2 domain-containing protein [Pseudomonadota bacterium]|jgi:anti-sigma factor RsiW